MRRRWLLGPVALVAALAVTLAASAYYDASGTGLGTAKAGFFTNPVTELVVSAPGSVQAGDRFRVTVTAKDKYGNTVSDYSGKVRFSTSDPSSAVTLPGDFTFAPADGGVHTFANAFVLATAGSQTVTATDAAHAAITGTSGNIAVSPGVASQLALTGASPLEVGTGESLTATIEDQFGNTVSTGADSTRTVSFGAVGGSGALSGLAASGASGGIATDDVTGYTGGSVDLRASATLSGGSVTSNTVTIAIGPGAATDALDGTPNPVAVGAPVTYTATVTGAGSTPTGSVTFEDGGVPISSCGPSGVVALSGGSAACTVTYGSTSPATHSITAPYSGDAGDDAVGSNTVVESVGKGVATVLLGSSLNPTTPGVPVTYTVTVTGGGVTPTGSVTFEDGGVAIGTCTAVALDGSGAASCPVTYPNTAGSPHQITASYSGDSNYGSSSSTAVSEAVNPGAPIIDPFDNGPVSLGGTIVFTATVDGTGDPPTGDVTWTVSGPGGVSACDSTTPLASGRATCTIQALNAGDYVVSDHYSGDSNYLSSTSAPDTVTVGQGTPSNAVTDNGPVSLGGSVVFSATVSGAGAAPTGTVTWSVSGSAGATVCDSTTPLSGGVASCTIAANAAGTYVVSETYDGDSNYLSAASNTDTVDVAKGSPTNALSDNAPVTLGQNIVLTANVGGGGPIPTGTVAWSVTGSAGASACTSTTVLSGGLATCTITAAGAGTYVVSETYGGDSNYLPAGSGTDTVTVAGAVQPAFVAPRGVTEPTITLPTAEATSMLEWTAADSPAASPTPVSTIGGDPYLVLVYEHGAALPAPIAVDSGAGTPFSTCSLLTRANVDAGSQAAVFAFSCTGNGTSGAATVSATAAQWDLATIQILHLRTGLSVALSGIAAGTATPAVALLSSVAPADGEVVLVALDGDGGATVTPPDGMTLLGVKQAGGTGGGYTVAAYLASEPVASAPFAYASDVAHGWGTVAVELAP